MAITLHLYLVVTSRRMAAARPRRSDALYASAEMATCPKPLMPKIFNVLFLCTGNSARSILAEALLNDAAKGRIAAYSAGSHPRGEVYREALALLKEHGIPAAGLRSKSWDEFAVPGAPAMDFVITVCDRAAGEDCPRWPGHPITAHWGLPDPAAAGTDAERRRIFRSVFTTLQRRIGMLAGAELGGADRRRLRRLINEIRDHVPLSDARGAMR